MKSISIMIICSLFFISICGSISCAKGAFFFLSLETDKETYYPFDTIKITASWNLILEESEEIKITLFFYDINNAELIAPIYFEPIEGLNSNQINKSFAELSKNFTYFSKVYINLQFNSKSGETNFFHEVNLMKFTPQINNCQSDFKIIKPSPIQWESDIIALQNESCRYNSSFINILLIQNNHTVKTFNDSAIDGRILINYSSVSFNETGNFTLLIIINENLYFYSNSFILSLYIASNITNFDISMGGPFEKSEMHLKINLIDPLYSQNFNFSELKIYQNTENSAFEINFNYKPLENPNFLLIIPLESILDNLNQNMIINLSFYYNGDDIIKHKLKSDFVYDLFPLFASYICIENYSKLDTEKSIIYNFNPFVIQFLTQTHNFNILGELFIEESSKIIIPIINLASSTIVLNYSSYFYEISCALMKNQTVKLSLIFNRMDLILKKIDLLLKNSSSYIVQPENTNSTEKEVLSLEQTEYQIFAFFSLGFLIPIIILAYNRLKCTFIKGKIYSFKNLSF